MYAHSNDFEQRRPIRSGRTRLYGTLMLALVMLLLAVGQARAAVNSLPPTPYFATPVNGSIVSDIETVIVFAPEYALYTAELGVDGEDWRQMSYEGNGSFSLKWNTGYASNGKHTLTARFTFEPGGPPVAAISIRVWVSNAEPGGQAGGELQGRPNSVASHVCLPVITAFSIANPPYCGYPGA